MVSKTQPPANTNGNAPVVYLIGAPRSGTTLLERMLSSHESIMGGPEPHLMTPLAHLGVWRNVDKAPYDHIVAGMAQKTFVSVLPSQDDDYWHACRAYCDSLYQSMLSGTNAQFFLDKTPEYATILPFLSRVYPDTKYILLTRHPAAIFVSFAESFFDGDFELANRHDPILERYIGSMAAFKARDDVDLIHIQYEQLVNDPITVTKNLCEFLNVEYSDQMIDYGQQQDPERVNGMGDPINVNKHSKPVRSSLNKWASALASDPGKLATLKRIVGQLDPADLEILGYPIESLWDALDIADNQPDKTKWFGSAYTMERKIIVHGRNMVQSSDFLTRSIGKLRLACDVFLREY